MKSINQMSPSEFLAHAANEMQALGNIANRKDDYFSVTMKRLRQFSDVVATSETDGDTLGTFLTSERAA